MSGESNTALWPVSDRATGPDRRSPPPTTAELAYPCVSRNASDSTGDLRSGPVARSETGHSARWLGRRPGHSACVLSPHAPRSALSHLTHPRRRLHETPSARYHVQGSIEFHHQRSHDAASGRLFPHVIEMNYQAGRRLGVNIYLIDGGTEFLLIDVGYLDQVDEVVELIRQMDFNLSTCKMIIATHADADHVQGIARAKELLKTKVAAHPLTVEPLETGDKIMTFASIKAQHLDIPMPPCKIDILLNEGDTVAVGNLKTEGVAHARPHRWAAQLQDGQLDF